MYFLLSSDSHDKEKEMVRLYNIHHVHVEYNTSTFQDFILGRGTGQGEQAGIQGKGSRQGYRARGAGRGAGQGEQAGVMKEQTGWGNEQAWPGKELRKWHGKRGQ